MKPATGKDIFCIIARIFTEIKENRTVYLLSVCQTLDIRDNSALLKTV